MKVCEICNKAFEKQGQLNLHKYHCRIKHNNFDGYEKEQKECEHSFRLLNLNSAVEKNAYKNGYMEVCSTCQMVR